MTYKDMFVVEVKVDGKILRVRDDAVYLPFGSEYSLLLKNLNSKRASVSVSIDSENILDNQSLILEPNTSTELEGFLTGNRVKNRFRFIQKTKEIQEHRGDRAGDGLVRVEFAFEKPLPEPKIANVIKEVHHHYNQPWTYTFHNDPAWCHYDSHTAVDSKSSDNNSITVDYAAVPVVESNVRSLGIENSSNPLEDEGITVKGSECNQSFSYTTVGQLEESNVIVIQLKGSGETGDQISEPITVQKKLVCSSCGKSSKSSFKFCPNCGTFLE